MESPVGAKLKFVKPTAEIKPQKMALLLTFKLLGSPPVTMRKSPKVHKNKVG